MTSPSETWKENTSGRERVRIVVDTLDEPATINSIAKQADVAWETAASEVERLNAENKLRESEDGLFEPNPVQQFLDQILQLIEDQSKTELEAQLEAYQAQLEAFENDHGVSSATEMRERLTNDDVSATEMREIRNISDTWGALELEIRLLKNALQLYDDLARLSLSNGETPTTV